jgi:outer membrane protein assembly factor BamE
LSQQFKSCGFLYFLLPLFAMSVLTTAFSMRSSVLCATVLTACALSACSSLDKASTTLSNLGGVITPYKIDIIQGNFVSKEQLAAVSAGMPKTQVRDVLGSPLLTSVFHADRWDYVFSLRRQGQEVQQRRVTVFFKDDLVERIDADELPTEAEFVASMDSRKISGKPPVLEATPEALKAFAERNVQAERPPEPVPPITNYPPLEAAQ